MKKILIDLIVGARPNFMKVAPIMAEMAKHRDMFEQRLIHTGQHYDHNMSQVFFQDLELPEPDVYLGVGSKKLSMKMSSLEKGRRKKRMPLFFKVLMNLFKCCEVWMRFPPLRHTEIRQKKSTDAEKAGATAATKILFPMLFLIVPAVFIVVAAPIVLELVGQKK